MGGSATLGMLWPSVCNCWHALPVVIWQENFLPVNKSKVMRYATIAIAILIIVVTGCFIIAHSQKWWPFSESNSEDSNVECTETMPWQDNAAFQVGLPVFIMPIMPIFS